MGQRLVRKLCPHCKKAVAAKPEEKQLIDFIMRKHPHPIEVPEELALYHPGSCEKCGHTGFKGRMGVYEGIVMDDAVEAVVINDPREHVILEAAKPQGIPTMVEDGIEKVVNGETSLGELERVIELPWHKANETPQAPTPKVETEKKKPSKVDDDFLAHVV